MLDLRSHASRSGLAKSFFEAAIALHLASYTL